MSELIISPSFLRTEKSKRKEVISSLNDINIAWLHYDIMDGKFVERTNLSIEEIKELNPATKLFKDFHLMISNPLDHVQEYAEAGAQMITFHYEACYDDLEVLETIKKIRSLNVKVGLAINPATPAEMIYKFLKDVDMVLVMSVIPGKGGQSFIPTALSKILGIKNRLKLMQKDVLIEVDGGINDYYGPLCRKMGADVLVCGSYLVEKEDIKERLKKLYE